jgi:thioredoxin reductase
MHVYNALHAHPGQLMLTSDIENFPGYPEGIEGPHMMQDLKKQVRVYVYENILHQVLMLPKLRRLSALEPKCKRKM